jgi:hypothetical protein
MSPNNQFDGSEQLGSRLGEFGWNKGRAKFLLGAWIALFVISLPLALALIGLPGLILSIYFIYRSLKRLSGTKPVLLLYQQGLIDYRQGTPGVICYEDIKALFLSVVRTNGVLNYVLTLETKNGRKTKIDEHVANVDHLRTVLEEQLVQHQLPAMIANYQQGNAIEFGRLTLTQAGLAAGKRRLPWSEFELADVQRRSQSVAFFIRQKGNQQDWFYSPRDDFPNLALFFALVNYITEARGPANSP